MKHALGFLEVRGLVAGIECADAMLKAANVRLATQITTNPALITLIVEGDIGSCRAAIDAGRLAAERLGAMISEKVIGRPEPDLALFVNARPRWQAPDGQPGGNGSKNEDGNSGVQARVAVSPEAPESLPNSVDPSLDPLQALINYLTPIPNGKRLDQLATSVNMPVKTVHALLNTALNQGRLKKLGSRYMIP